MSVCFAVFEQGIVVSRPVVARLQSVPCQQTRVNECLQRGFALRPQRLGAVPFLGLSLSVEPSTEIALVEDVGAPLAHALQHTLVHCLKRHLPVVEGLTDRRELILNLEIC